MRMKRPPIIAVVGHVDHGKTTLLDHIRSSRVAAGEAGGITQACGAYEIVHNGQKMTFIDTPGHQAFMGMRERGANMADVAILVVSAEDGVQEQTKESIRIVTESKTPYMVAVTKIDRQPKTDKAKNDLMQEGVLLEGYGGDISWAGVSGATGEGVSDLLDLISLVADTLDLQFDPDAPAAGFVLEAKKDAKRGVTVQAIVTDGTLAPGTDIATPTAGARVRSLEDAAGKRIESCTASAPVTIVGFKDLPAVGARFAAGTAESVVETARPQKLKIAHVAGVTAVNVIVKADSQGALEAAAACIRAIEVPAGAAVRVVAEGVGEITDGDVQWFVASESEKGMVIGFNVGATKTAEGVAKAHRIAVVSSKIIYELVKSVEDAIKAVTKAAATGELEILALFGKKGAREHVVGGKVVSGAMKSGADIEIERDGAEIGKGKIVSLQTGKKPAESVEAGNECGLLVEADIDMKVGDRLIIR